jgi:hypothetical protein
MMLILLMVQGWGGVVDGGLKSNVACDIGGVVLVQVLVGGCCR